MIIESTGKDDWHPKMKNIDGYNYFFGDLSSVKVKSVKSIPFNSRFADNAKNLLVH